MLSSSQSAPEYRVVITGSRGYEDRATIRSTLEALTTHANVTIVHGGARGADRIAAEEAGYIGFNVEEHPANWAMHGKRAGILRNLEMLDLGATRVIAFWDGESKGTAHTIRAAQERGMRVSIVRPATTAATHPLCAACGTINHNAGCDCE